MLDAQRALQDWLSFFWDFVVGCCFLGCRMCSHCGRLRALLRILLGLTMLEQHTKNPSKLGVMPLILRTTLALHIWRQEQVIAAQHNLCCSGPQLLSKRQNW